MDENVYYLQIDLIKAIAIISVIILHTLPSAIIKYPILAFTIYQAIPVLFIIMGINTASSFKRRGYLTLSQILSLTYFKNRFKRLILPFIIIFIASILIGILLNQEIYFGILTLIGYLPLTGPGNYFISLIFQFIFVFPVLYYFYRQKPTLTLALSFMINFIFEILAAQYAIFLDNSYIYRACILRYLFLIVLGIWASDNLNTNSLNNLFRNKVAIIGLIISVIYILLVSGFGWYFPYFQDPWQPQVILSFFYPLFICAIGLRYFPNTGSKIINLIAMVGKASYHIFLVQILFFGAGFSLIAIVLKTNLNVYMSTGIMALMGNILIVVIIGIIFYKLELKFKYI